MCAAQRSSGTGRGFDIQMHSVHQEFLDAVSSLLRAQFQDMGYGEEKFVAAVLAGLGAEADPAAGRLLGFLDGLASFETFGEMMEDSFERLYGAGAGAGGSGGQGGGRAGAGAGTLHSPVRALLRPPGSAPALAPAPVSALAENSIHNSSNNNASNNNNNNSNNNNSNSNINSKLAVRVLWDIENVSVGRRAGGMQSIARLHDFLATKGMFGPGIDLR
jgi:hypothetical protein